MLIYQYAIERIKDTITKYSYIQSQLQLWERNAKFRKIRVIARNKVSNTRNILMIMRNTFLVVSHKIAIMKIVAIMRRNHIVQYQIKCCDYKCHNYGIFIIMRKSQLQNI